MPGILLACPRQAPVHNECMALQAALTKRITNRARLEAVARQVIASSTDKLFEVGLDEHKVSFAIRLLYSQLGHTAYLQHTLCLKPLHAAIQVLTKCCMGKHA